MMNSSSPLEVRLIANDLEELKDCFLTIFKEAKKENYAHFKIKLEKNEENSNNKKDKVLFIYPADRVFYSCFRITGKVFYGKKKIPVFEMINNMLKNEKIPLLIFGCSTPVFSVNKMINLDLLKESTITNVLGGDFFNIYCVMGKDFTFNKNYRIGIYCPFDAITDDIINLLKLDTINSYRTIRSYKSIKNFYNFVRFRSRQSFLDLVSRLESKLTDEDKLLIELEDY